MMEHPSITIITPVYKKRDTILDTVRSVCCQTYPSIQYIIVDDGPDSVDDSIIDYIHSLNDKVDVKILRNDENRGTSYSLNRAVKESYGEYIFNIADDDCFSSKDVISDWVSEFIRTGAEVMTAKRAVYDETMTEMECVEPSESVIEKIRTLSNDELFNQMSGYNYIFGSVTAKKRSVFERPYGLYDERYRIIEDYSSNMRLLRNGVRFVFFDYIVLNYRRGGISFAGHVDDVYMKESDELFRNEILPYVSCKIVSRYRYRKWKRSVIRHQRGK